jgi:hypothetical protein
MNKVLPLVRWVGTVRVLLFDVLVALGIGIDWFVTDGQNLSQTLLSLAVWPWSSDIDLATHTHGLVGH